jgi:hypothetical protein
LKAYHEYIIKKYNAEPGYITMNIAQTTRDAGKYRHTKPYYLFHPSM